MKLKKKNRVIWSISVARKFIRIKQNICVPPYWIRHFKLRVKVKDQAKRIDEKFQDKVLKKIRLNSGVARTSILAKR